MTLLPPQTYGLNNNDVYTAAPYLDLAGVSYSVGSTDYNLYDYSGSVVLDCNSVTDPTCHTADGVSVQFTLTPATTTSTPEPGTLILLGSGLLGLFGISRRKLLV
jgi:hypothetical protein